MERFKLMGLNNIVAFSPSGNFLAVAGYDGTVKILDTSTGKAIVRHRIPGFKHETIIHHHQWSADDQFYAFSCCAAVFVIHVGNRSLMRSVPVSKEERQLTVPMVFGSDCRTLIVADAGRVFRHQVQSDKSELVFEVPNGRISAALDTNGNEDIAYKALEESSCDKLFIWDGKEQSLRKLTLPFEPNPSSQMFLAIPRFVNRNAILVLRKSLGLSWYSLATLKEKWSLTWDQLGFFTRHSFNKSKFTSDGRYLFVNAETPDIDPKSPDSWAVREEDMQWVIYDISDRKKVLAFANGWSNVDIHPPTRRIALLQREWIGRKRIEHVQLEQW